MNIPDWGLGELIAIGIIGLIALSMVLLAFIWFLRHGGKIKTAKGSIGSGTEDKPEPPHKGCLHAGDFLTLDNMSREIGFMEGSGPQTLVKLQMKYYEKKEVILFGIAEKVFISALADKLGLHDDIISHPLYHIFTLVLDKMHEVLSDYIRVAMRDNGLVEKEGTVWSEYKSTFKKGAQTLITGVLNDFWRSDVLKREELYRANMASPLAQLTADAFEEVLEYCRNESVEYEKVLNQKKNIKTEFLKIKVTGEA